jgi:hypothetical protein
MSKFALKPCMLYMSFSLALSCRLVSDGTLGVQYCPFIAELHVVVQSCRFKTATSRC